MNIGLKIWSTNLDNYAKEALRLYKLGCFNYIELYAVPNTLESLNAWKNLNIPFTLHCPHSAHGFNLAKAELADSNRKLFDEVRRFADGLNVDYIIIHGGLDGDYKETARQLKALNEPRALIENKPYRAVPKIAQDKTCIGYNKEQIEYIKNESGCGFCLDFNHAICASNSFKINYLDYIQEMMELNPDMFHLADMEKADSEIDTQLHLGEGQVDLKSLKRFLSIDSKVSLETAKKSRTSLEDFIADFNYYRSLW